MPPQRVEWSWNLHPVWYRCRNRLAKSFHVYPLTEQIVLTAIRGARDFQLSYYDAQLWATALLNQVSVIFSEDFSSGSSIESVRLINPFAPQFNLADWQ